MSSGRFLPVEDGAAKWTRVLRATQEEIPDRVCKLLRLRVGCEAHSTSRAPDADCHYLSFRLARLNIRCEEGAVGQCRPREYRVIVYVAYLEIRSMLGEHGVE